MIYFGENIVIRHLENIAGKHKGTEYESKINAILKELKNNDNRRFLA